MVQVAETRAVVAGVTGLVSDAAKLMVARENLDFLAGRAAFVIEFVHLVGATADEVFPQSCTGWFLQWQHHS